MLAERFELLERVADGATADVYRALDRRRSGHAAIKVLHRFHVGAAEIFRRFAREEEIAGLVGAAGAPCLGSSTSPPADATAIGAATRPWIAFEFLDGDTLRQRLRARPLDAAEAASLAAKIAERLAAVHRAGVVHGDLKPGNVMLLRDGDVRLIDFGSAWLREPGAAPQAIAGGHERHPIGTPAYASPERHQGAPSLDPRADLYALGVILFELACGRRPFSGDPVAQIVASASQEPPHPRALRPSLSPQLEAVIESALAKDPVRRPATAEAMRDAILATPEARRSEEEMSMITPTTAIDRNGRNGRNDPGDHPEHDARGDRSESPTRNDRAGGVA